MQGENLQKAITNPMKGSLIDIMSTLYLSGKSLREVGRCVGKPAPYIGSKLRENGVFIRRKGSQRKHSSIDVMITLYLSGKSLREIGEDLGKSKNYVSGRLKENGILMRGVGSQKRYTFNEDYFEIIDSGNKSYWVGFLAADGNVNSNNNVISLKLHTRDRDMVEKFKEILEATYPIIDKIKERGYKAKTLERNSNLRINSNKMKTDLIDKGVVPRKSLILKPPKNVPDHLVSHWIRGYFDGDGCIYIKRTNYGKNEYLGVSITGTKTVLEFIQDELDGVGYIRSLLNPYTWKFRINKQVDVIKFANYIYRDADTFMERKWLKFQN